MEDNAALARCSSFELVALGVHMIVAEQVSKYYGARAAVSDLSFSIESGEVIGLLGLNGAGKTTTLRILSGLLVPTSGKVFIAGLDSAKEPEAVRSRIGFLPETPPVYPEMRVDEFLTFAAHIRGVSAGVEEAVREAMSATDLTEVRDAPIGTLSHGYQRRIGIAQAIVHKPALILLDEPTSGLDPVQVVHMRNLIRALHKRHTVMVSSHILSEIHQLCDRIFVLQEGRIAASGTEAQLAQKVTGGVSLSVEVRGKREQLSTALAGLTGMTRYTIDADNAGVLSASIELSSDLRPELARALIGAGLGLLKLERVQLELESIFLKLTGASLPPSNVIPMEKSA
jgi:ABC-2 type transport system ATP-binding protein